MAHFNIHGIILACANIFKDVGTKLIEVLLGVLSGRHKPPSAADTLLVLSKVLLHHQLGQLYSTELALIVQPCVMLRFFSWRGVCESMLRIHISTFDSAGVAINKDT